MAITPGWPRNFGPDSKYQVNAVKVAYEKAVAEDEIDMDMGFIMMPDAIPKVEPPPGPGPIPPELKPPGPDPIPPDPKPPGQTRNLLEHKKQLI